MRRKASLPQDIVPMKPLPATQTDTGMGRGLARRSLVRLGARVGLLGVLVATGALAGCGFALRRAQPLPFKTVAVTPEGAGGVAADLSRYFGDALRPVAPANGGEAPEVIVDILQEQREKSVVGTNASGQVREFQLRLRLRFRLRTFTGRELIAPVDIEQRRDMSFNESAVLAKEAEEGLLYRDMQADIVQQILRRLAAVKAAATP